MPSIRYSLPLVRRLSHLPPATRPAEPRAPAGGDPHVGSGKLGTNDATTARQLQQGSITFAALLAPSRSLNHGFPKTPSKGLVCIHLLVSQTSRFPPSARSCHSNAFVLVAESQGTAVREALDDADDGAEANDAEEALVLNDPGDLVFGFLCLGLVVDAAFFDVLGGGLGGFGVAFGSSARVEGVAMEQIL